MLHCQLPEASGHLPRVRATGSELNQVWMNLLDNALDAVSDSGNIQIKAVREANRVIVSIIDDGQGIPADVLPHIFDAFFTTKQPGQGTDLGLEITRRLLRLYHGDIAVKSRPGRTEFNVTLLVQESSSKEVDERSRDKSGKITLLRWAHGKVTCGRKKALQLVSIVSTL